MRGVDYTGGGVRTFLCLTFFLAAWSGSAPAEDAPPLQTEILTLSDRLEQNLQEEAALRRENRREARIATRPYTEYLLYQKSLHFSDHAARLEELKQERMEMIGRLTQRQEEAGLPADSLQEVRERSLDSFPTYSGAPLLSFYDPTPFDPVSSSSYPPMWTNLLRFSFSMILLLIFVLPMIAFRKLWSDLRHREVLRIFPVFTVRRPNGTGRLELLHVVTKKGG